jgi:hypothetical protein
MTATTAKRSNRPLTQFACRHLVFFLQRKYQSSGKRTEGNTTVCYEIEQRCQRFTVYLFEDPILVVTLDEWKPFSVCVSFTGFYDSYGQPSKTTCERLNGLLDELGAQHIIPSGVRVFRGTHDTTYLGKGDDKVAVGRELADSVFLRPGIGALNIVGTLLSHEVEP